MDSSDEMDPIMTSKTVPILNFEPQPLKRSISVTELIIHNLKNLSIRDTKSFTGTMDDIKYHHKFLEKIRGRDREINFYEGIETKDRYDNDTIVINKEVLSHKGRNYSIHDIAFRWKKDCRMWLWKNDKDFRRDKSVGDNIKTKLITG